MSRLLVLFAGLLAAGCQPKEVQYKLNIVTSACHPPQPLESVTHLRIRVTGDGIPAPIDSVSPIEARELILPPVPAGAHRVVEVRAYAGEPGSEGKLVSLGRSLPFEVPDVVPKGAEPIELNVFVRRVNKWTSPSSASAANTCARMLNARAGHTATLLQDGRVFIAGGYQLKESGEPLSLYKAELFNPATGAFEDARDIGLTNVNQQFVPLARAFHTATLLHSGQVLLWGGEDYLSGGVVSHRASVLVFDPDQNKYGGVPFTNTANIGRSQHAAALDKNGKVLVVGGYTKVNNALALVEQVEWFDPDTTKGSVLDGISLPREGMGVAPVQDGGLIAVAGGSDGGTLTDEVTFFEFTGTTFAPKPASPAPKLREPRRAAAATSFGEKGELLVSGGYSDLTRVTPLSSSEILSTQSPFTVSPGPLVGARGELCAATLPDGRVLAVGGRTVDVAGGPARSDGTTVLLVPMPDGSTTQVGQDKLTIDRYHHTCTTLVDGSVLVLGGVRENGGTREVLKDAYLFTPAPLDP